MLSVTGLCKAFGDNRVLSMVSFDLRSAQVTCLLGSNGSGKTTLFNLISGFLRPDCGSIRLGDVELTEQAPYLISRLGIARTFQDLRLISKLTVRENVFLALPDNSDNLGAAILPPIIYRRRENENGCKADMLLEDFNLAGVADQPASDISYGQQKLLTLACCAAMNSDVLLLDEPVAGISPQFREDIARKLLRMKELGKAILLIEHQPDFLELTGDVFLLLRGGHLKQFESLAELRDEHLPKKVELR